MNNYLQYVTYGSIENELNIIAARNPNIGLYILSNMEKCKESILFVFSDSVFFIYTSSYILESLQKRLYFNSELTSLSISKYPGENLTELLLLKDEIHTLIEVSYFSIEIFIKNMLVERLFMIRNGTYVSTTMLETRIFDV